MNNLNNSHELMLLLLDLQTAVKAFSQRSGKPYASVIPWQCDDVDVVMAWNKLTHRDNLDALITWKKAEEQNGQPTLLTQEALKQCHRNAQTGKL